VRPHVHRSWRRRRRQSSTSHRVGRSWERLGSTWTTPRLRPRSTLSTKSACKRVAGLRHRVNAVRAGIIYSNIHRPAAGEAQPRRSLGLYPADCSAAASKSNARAILWLAL
jgi:hypothetical protein